MSTRVVVSVMTEELQPGALPSGPSGIEFSLRLLCAETHAGLKVSDPLKHKTKTGVFERRRRSQSPMQAQFGVRSPHQVWRAGRETLQSSTQRQVPTLGLEPTSGQDVFWGADLPPKRAHREIIPGWLGASLGAECLISRSPSQHARLTEGIQPLTSHQRAKCSPQRN